MLRILTAICLASMFISQTALAEESKGKSKDSDFARYSVNLSASLFGPAANFGYNLNRKTTFVFGMGGFSGDAPIEPKIGDKTYKMSGDASWVGFFVNHRPIKDAKWFRVVAGLGIGNIENDLEDTADVNKTYKVVYNENPVGYLGVGFGVEAKKGFLWGVDIGFLQTGGAAITQTGTASSAETIDEFKDNWMFGSVLPNFQFSLGWGF